MYKYALNIQNVQMCIYILIRAQKDRITEAGRWSVKKNPTNKASSPYLYVNDSLVFTNQYNICGLQIRCNKFLP